MVQELWVAGLLLVQLHKHRETLLIKEIVISPSGETEALQNHWSHSPKALDSEERFLLMPVGWVKCRKRGKNIFLLKTETPNCRQAGFPKPATENADSFLSQIHFMLLTGGEASATDTNNNKPFIQYLLRRNFFEHLIFTWKSQICIVFYTCKFPPFKL